MRSTRQFLAAHSILLSFVLFGAAVSEAGNVSVTEPPIFARESLAPESSVKVDAAVDYTVGVTLPPGSSFKITLGLDGSFKFDSPVFDSSLTFTDPAVQANATVTVGSGGGPNSSSVTFDVLLGGGANQGLDPGDTLRYDPPGGAFYTLVGDTLIGENNPAEVSIDLFDANNVPIDLGGNHTAILANSKRAISVEVENPGFKRIDDQDSRFFEGGGLVDDTARVNLLFDNTVKLPNGLAPAGLQDLGDVEITIYSNGGSFDPLASLEFPNFDGGRELLTQSPNLFQGIFQNGNTSAQNQTVEITISGSEPLTNLDLLVSAAFLALDPNQPVFVMADTLLTKWRDLNSVFDDSFESGDTNGWSGAVP